MRYTCKETHKKYSIPHIHPQPHLLYGYALVQTKGKHHADEAEGEYGELLSQLIHVLLQGGAWGLLLLHHPEQLPKL